MPAGATAAAVPVPRRSWLLWTVASLVLLLSIAGYVAFRISQRLQSYRELAKASAERFHSQLDAGDISGIIADAAPAFREKPSPEELRLMLEGIRAKLGPFQSTQPKALSWNVKSGVGQLLTAEFETQYRFGAAREVFTLLLTDDGGAQLYGYNISSPILLKK